MDLKTGETIQTSSPPMTITDLKFDNKRNGFWAIGSN